MKYLKEILFMSLLAALSLPGLACDARAPIWERNLQTLGPVAVDGRLVYLVGTTGQVVVVDPEEGVRSHSVGERPRTLVATPGGVGVIAGRGDAPVFDRIALADGERTRVELGSPYDRIWVSPSGAHALLTFDPSAPQAPGAVPARNNNEVGLVDLGSGTADTLLLQTESLAPREVIFSDDGTLAAVLLDSALALIDLVSDPTEVVTVPLRLSDGTLLSPKKALFAEDADYLFLTVQGSPDVLSLEIMRGGTLGAAVNFLFTPDATGVQDIIRVEGEPGHVAALFWRPSGSVLSLLEASGDTSLGQSVFLDERPTRLFDLGGGHLLAAMAAASSSRGAFSRYVAAWSLSTGRLDEDALLGTYNQAPRVGSGRAFFSHGDVVIDSHSVAGAITVLQTDEDTLRLRVRLAPVVLSGSGVLASHTLEDGSLLAGVLSEREDSGAPPDFDGDLESPISFLVSVSGEGQPGEGLVLDARADAVGTTGGWAWARHSSSVGDLTLVPLDDLRRERARRFRGFLLSALTDAEEIQ